MNTANNQGVLPNFSSIVGSPYLDDLYVIAHRGPLIDNYLEKIKQVLDNFLTVHPRVIAIRVDLRFPGGYVGENESYVTRFIESFKSKVNASQNRSRREGKAVHATKVGYIWVKEYGGSGGFHYHLVLLLNGDAFYQLGFFNVERENLYTRIVEAWASALGVHPVIGRPGVHIPENAIYRLRGEGISFVYKELFYRLSYFAKMESKMYQQGRNFGSSQLF